MVQIFKKFKSFSVGRKIFVLLVALFIVLLITFDRVLSGIGNFLVIDSIPVTAEAVVVLNTGVEYYPRLIEAAKLYNKGLVKKIVVNGNRKTDELRFLEAKGFSPCCHWCEDRQQILEIYNVPRSDIICISAEDVYDTVSEAEAVGTELIKTGINSIIVTTSKSHTRRAGHIWKTMYDKKFLIQTVAAKTDPYNPNGWWKSGRQIRWVLAEYGAWLYYWWKTIQD